MIDTARLFEMLAKGLPQKLIFIFQVGCCVAPPSLVVISQHMAWGSLYGLLHSSGGTRGVVLDAGQAVRLASDVARGMAFLHSLQRDKTVPAYHLSSKHIMVGTCYTHSVPGGNQPAHGVGLASDNPFLFIEMVFSRLMRT